MSDAASGAVEATAAAAEAGSGETVAEAASPATIHPPTAAAEDAPDMTPPSPQDGARVRNSLETIKTAIVWLVVIQILTILSPLLPTSLTWTLIVGVVLTTGSFAVAAVAYLKAQRAQRSLPE
jgi:hypothetical protein